MKPATLLLVAVNAFGLASAAAVANPEAAAVANPEAVAAANPEAESIGNPDEAVTGLEARACFKTGQKYGDMDRTYQKVKDLCAGPFKGTYKKHQSRSFCRNVGSNSVKYTIGLDGHNAGAKRIMNYDECKSGLDKEIKNCNKGGETTYGNWRYRVDPNSGPC